MRWRKVCVIGIVAALGAAAAWRVVHPPVDTVEEACAVAARWYPEDAEKLRVALTNLYAHDGAYGMVSIQYDPGSRVNDISLRLPYTNQPSFVLSELKYERLLLRLYAQPEKRLQAAELLLLGRHTNYCGRVVNKFPRDLATGLAQWDPHQPAPPQCFEDARIMRFAVPIAAGLPDRWVGSVEGKYSRGDEVAFLQDLHAQLEAALRARGMDEGFDSWSTFSTLYDEEVRARKRRGRHWWWYLDPRHWRP